MQGDKPASSWLRRGRRVVRRQLYRHSLLSCAWLEAKRLAAVYGLPLGRDGTIEAGESVFVHIPKNGGTSIIEALGRNESLHSHATAALVKARRRREEPRLMFAVVRNPWDRLTSTFRYLTDEQLGHPFFKDDPKVIWKANARVGSFREFVLSLSPLKVRSLNLLQPQYYYVCDRRGRLLVDELLRFESLEEDFAAMVERWRLPFSELPRRNATATGRDYVDYYDSETLAIVERLYARDVELFGYSFGRSS